LFSSETGQKNGPARGRTGHVQKKIQGKLLPENSTFDFRLKWERGIFAIHVLSISDKPENNLKI
jgi:hypothetical protein